MFRWNRSEHKIREKSWEPDLFRSGSVCGIWIRLKTMDLDLDPFESADLDPDLDPFESVDLDLDPFETEPGSVFGSGSASNGTRDLFRIWDPNGCS